MLHNEIRTPIVGIVDYGAGNLTSVLNAVKKIAKNSYISSNPDELIDADYIILPGVGTFDEALDIVKKSMVNLVEKI
jgi:imidazole glycerol-phosphate synthase subunit HisH